jgi:hypothetical protein
MNVKLLEAGEITIIHHDLEYVDEVIKRTSESLHSLEYKFLELHEEV